MSEAVETAGKRQFGSTVRSFLAVGTALFAIVPSAARADDQAVFLVKLFMSACIPSMGSPDAVRSWAAAKHLSEIHDAAPLALFVGAGDKGAACAIPSVYGNFALSVRGLTQACAVWAQKADPAVVESDFKKLVDGVKRPGLRVRVDKDSTTQTPAGRARELVYNIAAIGAPASYEFVMLTAERPGSGFQANLQVAHGRGQ